ncbi:MAG TPA: hypothetical protein VF796_13600, partial [Humisphaera sp.]
EVMTATTTRADHLAWCKERALAYLADGDASQAWASMCSDLRKHPATAAHEGIVLGMRLLVAGHLDGPDAMRRHIEGFN